MEHDQQQLSPPVVAVVVTHDPGPHLDETLRALAAQDASNVTCLVLAIGVTDPNGDRPDTDRPGTDRADTDRPDTDRADTDRPDTDRPDVDPLAARVGTALPGAFIRRSPDTHTFADAANEALRLVEGGGGYFCFLHDDVVLDPDALGHLLDEAVRSNAAIVGPKLVAWHDSARLLSTGYSADKFGELSPLADPGELDQEQHDAVRDVFALSSACVMVRADLLRALQGFDLDIGGQAAVTDLCWRTHIAGGRVLVVPDARARHGVAGALDAFDEAVEEHGRLRSVVGNYSGAHLVRVLPQLAVVTLWQVLLALVTGRVGRARALVGAWAGALRPGSVGAHRRGVASIRQVPDPDVRRLQMHGSARLLALLRRRRRAGADVGGVGATVRVAGRHVAEGVRATTGLATAVVGGFTLLVVFGGRSLVTGRVPVVGSLVAFPAGGRSALRAFVHGWWGLGLGRPGPAPTGLGLLSLSSVVTLGNLVAFRTLLVLGLLVLGGLGAWRLAHPFASSLASIAAFVVYAGAPLGVDALGRGHLGGLVVYAATPWMLARVARLAALAPFGSPDGRGGPLLSTAAGLALQVAVVASLAPAGALVVPGCALVLLVAALVAGGFRDAVLGLVRCILATAVGIGLLLPWVPFRKDSWLGLGSLTGEVDRWRFGRLVRFATGPHGSAPLGFALVAAVVAAVLLARGPRLAWVLRGVVLAAAGFAVALPAVRGRLGQTPPEIEILLAPALAGLALALAAGAAAFDGEVRGRSFTWRQPVAFAGALAVLLAALPSFAAFAGGRFGMPSTDTVAPLRFLPPPDPGADQRLLWLGAPSALPPGSWRLTTGLAYAVTAATGPSLDDLWGARAGEGERRVAEAVALAADGQTDRLGHLLAPMGIRFVLLPAPTPAAGRSAAGTGGAAAGAATAAAAGSTAGTTATGTGPAAGVPGAGDGLPAALTGALAAQLDLRRVKIDDRVVVYQNTAWLPTIAQLDAASSAASRQVGNETLAVSDLSASPAVLSTHRAEQASGAVLPGTVYLARPYDERWSLTVDGQRVAPGPAFGWATAFTVPNGGQARLTYRTPLLRWLFLALQLAAWLVVGRLAMDATTPIRRRRRRPDPGAGFPLQPAPIAVAVPRRHDSDAIVWAESPAADAEVRALRDALRLPDELALRWADGEGDDPS